MATDFTNLSSTAPAAETGKQLVKWQAGSPYTATVDVNGVPTTVTVRDASAETRNIGGVDARTTNSETIGLSSQGKLVTLNNASAIAVTLDSSTADSNFFCVVKSLGAGVVTLTPSSGTINGASSLVVTDGLVFFNGTNWFCETGGAAGATISGVQQDAYVYASDTGSVNTYAVSISPVPTIVVGSRVIFKAANGNTGASTLNVNSSGAVSIKKNGTADLSAGDIVSGQMVSVIYDGTYYQVVAGAVGPAGVSGGAADIQKQTFIYGTDSGTGAAYAVTISGSYTSLVAGCVLVFIATNINTGACTVAINGGTAKSIKKLGTQDPVVADIGAGDMVQLVYDGTNWQLMNLRKHPAFPIPLAASLTGVNAGTSVIADHPTTLEIALRDSASLNWRIWTFNQPSTPYTVFLSMYCYQANLNSSTVGLYFYDGTKLMGIENLAQASNVSTLRVERINSVTSDNSTVASQAGLFPQITGRNNQMYLKLQNSGTNLYFFYSYDGEFWVQFYTEAVGTFITPTKVGIGGIGVTSTALLQPHIDVTGLLIMAGLV